MHHKGFTIFQVLTVVTLIGILATVAAPSYRAIGANRAAVALRNDFVSTLRLARAEAIRTGNNTSICPINATHDGCNPINDWRGGWIAFLNPTATLGTPGPNITPQSPGDIISRNIVTDVAAFFPTLPLLTFNDRGGPILGVAFSVGILVTGCSGNNAFGIGVDTNGTIFATPAPCP